LFDEVVIDYEKSRPKYGIQLFEDVIEYANITRNSSIIEVGCGTGQATEPFLKIKCKVTAVELGQNLATFSREKFKHYINLKIVQSSFEDYVCDDNTYDMLYSATAFHWIPPEIGYTKARRILKDGGTLALFWNRPSLNIKGNALHQKIQAIYQDFLPQFNNKETNIINTSQFWRDSN
jgi:ubiquinone/menaquinone biosynthesis C-methylase UbiE